MKKKFKKKLKAAINRAQEAEQMVKLVEIEADRYRKRLVNIGSNMEVVTPKDDGPITEVKWTADIQAWGHYIRFDHNYIYNSPDRDEMFLKMKKTLAEKLAAGLIEENLVQFIVKDPETGSPFSREGTLGVKLFVVPWEQMPHKRTIEIRQYIENSVALMEGKDDGRR